MKRKHDRELKDLNIELDFIKETQTKTTHKLTNVQKVANEREFKVRELEAELKFINQQYDSLKNKTESSKFLMGYDCGGI